MPTQHRGVCLLIIFASVIIIVAGLREARAMLTPLLVAAFLSILCVPPMRRLMRRGVPEVLALVIVLSVATSLLFFMTFILGNSIRGFEDNLTVYKDRLGTMTGDLATWLSGMGIAIEGQDLAARLDGGKLVEFVSETASALLAALSNMLLTLLTMVFILLEVNSIKRKIVQISTQPEADLSEFSRATKQVQRYLSTKAIVSLVTGLLVTGLCTAVGVDFPALWGLVAFLFNFVPSIGSIIASIPAMLLALVQFGPGSALILGLGYLSINVTIGNIIEPRIMGRRLGISPLVVFVSMFFWYWVWGPVGALLSVPLTVIIKIFLEHFDDLRPIAILLGSGHEDDVQPDQA